MNIIVLVKQVPDTTEIKIDKTNGTLIRTGVPSIINPDDLAGIEEALKLKTKYHAHITAISMGPPQVKLALQELIAMGIDEAILISDPKFAGSDTWATSEVLSSAIKKIPYDLIISGRQAIDGDTAQVGPQVAQRLSINSISYITKIEKIEDNRIYLEKTMDGRIEFCSVGLPCLISTLSEMNHPRYMHINNIWDSFNVSIPTWTSEDFDVDLNEVGIKGSPTKVKTTFNKELTASTNCLTLDPVSAAQLIVEQLKQKGCL